jgi:YidC/Oxa1 family membrane protein insertase
MDRQTVLAIALILIVLILPSLIFQPARQPPAPSGGETPDTVQAPGGEAAAGVSAPPPAVVDAEPSVAQPDTQPPPAPSKPVVVASPLYRYSFSPQGARLVGAELSDYRSFSAGEPGVAQLIPEMSQFLSYRFVFAAETLSLADWHFEPSQERIDVGPGGASLEWVARRGQATVRLTYTFRPDEYRFDVHGEFDPPASALALVGMGPRLRSIDRDSITDFRSYAVVTKSRSTDKLKFTSLHFGETERLDGPFEWVAIKSKYFLGAILAISEGQPQFGGVAATGGRRTPARTNGFFGRFAKRDLTVATNASVLASLPMPAGSFDFSVYLGPQEYKRLSNIGHDLEDVNPYGWILRPIIGPLSIIVVRILLWLHETLNLGYGWVLILFGVTIRLALWPLNQKAMRSQMAQQALQPELKALQERYKGDQAKQQQEMWKLYREHGASPLGGCLPMLLQMPILFTLFFVFLNTIELRGAPFLWLPDLSLADPLYIIPLFMGASMFALSKIGQIGVPPNPQSKMMLYFMPIVFTFLFLRFSSGLNLYYATSNLTSIPQQWAVAKERLRRAKKKKKAGGKG